MTNIRTFYVKLTNTKNFLIGMGVMLGVIWWILESVMHVFVFKSGGFVSELFPADPMETWMRSVILVLLIGFGVFVQFVFNQKTRAENEKENLINELQASIAEIKILQGMIPICANCKKIRDDKGFWQHLEKYIQDRSEAEFSHGICPDCTEELYPGVLNKLQGNPNI